MPEYELLVFFGKLRWNRVPCGKNEFGFLAAKMFCRIKAIAIKNFSLNLTRLFEYPTILISEYRFGHAADNVVVLQKLRQTSMEYLEGTQISRVDHLTKGCVARGI